ncbi:T9SS type A sorting domain-containing protein [Taibaiella lutea]|uniref:T9SS type A sorting domain-containing protein n=1 Tax=Taibaiella lutea TaxID=2608001 RepID=A0A5M6CI42_9BACT|nr:T9SS type A sorting domain-containing protein [Taibaiella lutea]KAA5534676.1 T9SS type A sorting domain-containing protein [Taibaiella lutea]
MKKSAKYLEGMRLVVWLFPIFILYQTSLQAQVILTGTIYTQNFDSIANVMPTGWTVDTGMTASFSGNDVSTTYFNNVPAANTGWSNTTGRFKNVASGIPYTFFADATSASQSGQSNRALGVRQNTAIDKNAGFVLKIANTTGFENFMLSFNLQSLDSNASRVTTWSVDYGIGNNPASFIPVSTTGIMTTGGNQFSKETITVDFGNALNNKSQPVYIRIVSLLPTTGTGNRTTSAIDNFSLSWSIMPPQANIELLSKTPTDTAISLSTNQLTLHYDNLIQPGSGQIDLYKTGNLLPTSFTVPSSAITINDSTAIVNGINLENNTSYYVLMPAGTFLKQSDTLPNHAITDTAYWTFSTVDTTPPPVPVLPSMLNESFSDCSDTAIGTFVQYNVSGTKTWKCNVNGHDDSAAISMSGGVAIAVSNTNEDWLISAEPYDFSGMTKPVLSFWQKRRFEGTVIRTIKISTNYISGTVPDSATWTILQVQDMSHRPDADIWSQVNGIDLTDFKGTPFFLAFTYACDTGGAYELSYDDIKVTDNPLNIITPATGNIGLKVLGEATSEKIILDFNLTSDTDLSIRMYDMTGKIVYQQNNKGKAGHRQILIENANIHAGLYIIKMLTNNGSGTIKIVVK